MSEKQNTSKIKKLDPETVERIAAGEVVEDPASVVKELVENSLDADATRIEIEVEEGGKSSIKVSDDGVGMGEEDALLAFQKHATSKISDSNDLEKVDTLGFRGEALPSIAQVSKVEMTTKSEGGVGATKVKKEGKDKEIEEAGRGVGTTVEVKDLFYNTPARQETLRSSRREFSKISSVVTKYALTHPDVSFVLRHGDRENLSTPGSGRYVDPLLGVYGRNVANRGVEVEYSTGEIEVSGVAVRPSTTRSSKNHVYTSVNGRALEEERIRKGAIDGYGNLLPTSRYPIAVVDVSLPPEEVDVNVHPSKKEVKFTDPESVRDAVDEALKDALSSEDLTKKSEFDFESPVRDREEDQKDSRFESLEVIGQFRGLYLLCEGDDDLVVVDQHAAHERINYEELLREYGGGEIESVELGSAETVELTPAEKSVVEEKFEDLEALGFGLEEFGGNMYRIREIPAPLGRVQDVDAVHEAIDTFLTEGNFEDVRDEILKDVACHPSLKAGDELSKEEATELIERLGSCDQPFACPHGRPTVLSVSEKKLAKGFGRENVRFDV